ncbi:MAG: radical SAM protein, partial [Nanoarchaeota archaeon]|nr:radical SAM protein [Nanoarchaeota archaeon]
EFKIACEKEGLFVEYIPYSDFLKERSKYSEKTPRDRLFDSVLAYISLDKNIAKSGKEFDLSKRSQEFGELLGYPKCCVDAYDVDKKIVKSKLISHVPCSENCEETKKYVNNLLCELKKENVNVENFIKQDAVFEKRKWVGITTMCNNRCIFCLDGEIKNKFHKSLSQIREEFDSGLREGCTRLVISGGDPTVHPEFLDIIRLGKEMGYKKVQTITNGRMFYYKKFLDGAVKSGLNEVTFSIHGHTAELHDSLTSAKGSFEQTVQGIKNALNCDLIVNVDIVLNKKNVRHFPEIIHFLLELGIREFDILQIMPFGNAMGNKEDLFYDIGDNLEFINKGFELAKERGSVVWTNRFPPQYLEGNEDLIQDPYKLFDEVNGRKRDFEYSLSKNIPLKCHGERCSLCCLSDFCKFVSSKNKLLNSDKKTIIADKGDAEMSSEKISKLKGCEILISVDGDLPKEDKIKFDELFDSEIKTQKEFEITKQNYINLSQNKFDDCTFSLVAPLFDYQEYELVAPQIKEILPALYDVINSVENPSIKNIPYCFVDEKYHKFIVQDDKNTIRASCLDDNFGIDIVNLTKDYIGHTKVKSLRCKKCVFNEKCEGIFQKYIMTYGFKELRPILK